MMQDNKYVFVCGLHKSGTSIFFKTLSEHPQISAFKDTGVPKDEGQHLQSVFPPATAFGGMGKFGFSPEAHLDETSPLLTEENKHKLMSEWGQYWDMDKPILLEKSPPNLVRTRFLQAMFPNSYFIALLRHPIATSYATKNKKLHETVLDSRLRHWLVCHDIFNEDKKYLSNLLTLKYEDFVKNTTASLKQIYAFLDLEFAPTTMEIRPNVNDKYFALWLDYRDKPVLKLHADYLVTRYEERINQYGYSLKDLNL